jgi:aldose 1-epimerase
MRKLFGLLSLLLIPALSASGVRKEKTGEPVSSDLLGTHNGSEVFLFTLTNRSGNILKLTNYGARIVRIEVPDRNGVRDNITMGSEVLDAILKSDPFGGATIGRYANRIANAKFILDGAEYKLNANNGPNTLHGGRNGWFTKVWNAEIIEKSRQPAVKFVYISPDMEEGFPGKVTMEVVYTWTDRNELIIEYSAITDRKTVINVTNHAYFNLHGAGNGYIFDHLLTINASSFTPFNAGKIPTGKIDPVWGTPYDFTSPHTIGERIGQSFENTPVDGYDNNFVLDRKGKVDAVVYDPVSGRVMEVMTDQPGLQFYSGNAMMWKRSMESGADKPTRTRSAFALETQHFPDSPNQPGFPSTILSPGEKFRSKTIYRFSVRKNN